MESLRLYPPLWIASRMPVADDVIGGYPRAGGRLDHHLQLPHAPASRLLGATRRRSTRERFTPEARKARHRYAYIPFGGGPRGCIGFPFAMMEMPLVLARVLQRYRLSLVPGHPSGVPESAISLRQRHGALMRSTLA